MSRGEVLARAARGSPNASRLCALHGAQIITTFTKWPGGAERLGKISAHVRSAGSGCGDGGQRLRGDVQHALAIMKPR